MMRTLAHAVCVSILSLVAGSPLTSAQTIDSVTFENVTPDVAGSGDFRSYSLENGGQIRSLRYSGTVTEINTATFINEITIGVVAAGVRIANQILSEVADFTGTADFSGIIPVDRNFDPGDFWSFTFLETFDDGSDGLADANLDITFDFSAEPAPEPTVSELGLFNLNQGTYERSFGSEGEYQYGIVPFTVSQPGNYRLDAEWLDTASNPFDGYLYLLDNPFTGTDTTAIASNDDFISTSFSRLNADLQADQTYFALLTTFSPSAGNNNLRGNLAISTLDGGTASVIAIPEPVSAPLLLATMIAATPRRRR